jgi:integrase
MLFKIDLAAAVKAVEQAPVAAMTLRELVHGCNVALVRDYDLRLRKWVDAFGDYSAWELSAELLENAAHALVNAGYNPSTVNRDLSALGSCYRWAQKRRLAPKGFRSPTLGVRRFEEAIRRIEVSAKELAKIRALSLTSRDRRFAVFVHLLLDTGARKSELLERHWADFDLERCQILCPKTKNGHPRILHFRPETLPLIKRVFRNLAPHALVFEGRTPMQPISYRAAWVQAMKTLGRPDLHMHDMRHAVAANLLRAGVTLGVAAQVLGHDPAVLARRYGHLETDTLRRAQEQAWRHADAA